MLNEEKIISYLHAAFPEYIGDDAAVIPGAKKKNYVVTKDLLIEDVHFQTAYCDPKSLAIKALHVNLSDIAAMGGCPRFIWLGVAIPQSQARYAKVFLRHFAKACKQAHVILAGGDTTRAPEKIGISVTAVGEIPSPCIKYRSTAKASDVCCVIGNLGLAHLGLIAHTQLRIGFKMEKKAFLTPQAKVAEGMWLGAQHAVTSMMDISDGLFIDFKRLCAASQVQGIIELENFAPPQTFLSQCKKLNLSPIEVMLSGGEDYGLLFTVNKKHLEDLAQRFRKKFGYPLHKIGYLKKGEGVRFMQEKKNYPMLIKPFSHFGESL